MSFRTWMPLVAILIVLLSVGTTIFYGIPASRARLEDYAERHLEDEAAATAEALAAGGEQDPRPFLEQAAKSSAGDALFFDENGRLIERVGPGLLAPESGFLQDLLQDAVRGEATTRETEAFDVSVALVVRGSENAGAVVLASDEFNNAVYPLFLRSALEAAGLASILGGGLMLLMATLLGRRVQRLAFGAQSIEQGDFSYRLPVGFNDELGALARTFNAMAIRLEAFVTRLEDTNETLGTILDNLTEGVLLTNLEGQAIFANRSARNMMNLGETELPAEVPEPWTELALREAVARCIEGGESVEARVQGEETFMHVKLYRLPESDERRDGALVVLQDLSEGKRLEENQQRFLANAAHEFKTPIAAIIGAAELLMTDMEDAATRSRFLDHISNEGRRLQRLSDAMLRLARTGLDQREPDLQSVDSAAVARKVAERMEALVSAGGLTIRVDEDAAGGDSARVQADPEWLEQALVVLLDNAVKHSGRGGDITLRVGGGRIIVEDEGEGISEVELPYVFERLHGKKGDSRSFGLGLPICRELVEKMGGRISISSERGVGTAVEISLPESRVPETRADAE